MGSVGCGDEPRSQDWRCPRVSAQVWSLFGLGREAQHGFLLQNRASALERHRSSSRSIPTAMPCDLSSRRTYLRGIVAADTSIAMRLCADTALPPIDRNILLNTIAQLPGPPGVWCNGWVAWMTWVCAHPDGSRRRDKLDVTKSPVRKPRRSRARPFRVRSLL